MGKQITYYILARFNYKEYFIKYNAQLLNSIRVNNGLGWV